MFIVCVTGSGLPKNSKKKKKIFTVDEIGCESNDCYIIPFAARTQTYIFCLSVFLQTRLCLLILRSLQEFFLVSDFRMTLHQKPFFLVFFFEQGDCNNL